MHVSIIARGKQQLTLNSCARQCGAWEFSRPQATIERCALDIRTRVHQALIDCAVEYFAAGVRDQYVGGPTAGRDRVAQRIDPFQGGQVALHRADGTPLQARSSAASRMETSSAAMIRS
jgi:hypothetical protein